MSGRRFARGSAIPALLWPLLAVSTGCELVDAHLGERLREQHAVALNLGLFDFDDRKRELEGGIEYRSWDLGYGVRPIAGAAVTTERGVYTYAGLRVEFNELDPVFFGPSLAVSLYDRGDGKDLGHVVEFRSGVDIGYRFESGLTVAIGLYHLSNAGLGEHNPGANSLSVTYAYEF